jgi:hypothetical protein
MISIPAHLVSSPCAGSRCCIVLSFALNFLDVNNLLEIRNSDLFFCTLWFQLELFVFSTEGPGWLNELGSCKWQKREHSTRSATDKVYQLLAHGRWFSPSTPAASTTKTGRHDIAEILLKVSLSTINQIKSNMFYEKRNCILFLKIPNKLIQIKVYFSNLSIIKLKIQMLF